MLITFPYKMLVRPDPAASHTIELEAGQPFDMPDEEAIARAAVGNVIPVSEEELMAAQARVAAKNAPADVVLEQKPEGIVLEQKPAKKKAADAADSAKETQL